MHATMLRVSYPIVSVDASELATRVHKRVGVRTIIITTFVELEAF